mgnify:CR=1 FL=1
MRQGQDLAAYQMKRDQWDGVHEMMNPRIQIHMDNARNNKNKCSCLRLFESTSKVIQEKREKNSESPIGIYLGGSMMPFFH